MAAPTENPFVIQGFKGINNRIDPVRLGGEYQLQADNALCDDGGYLRRRPGSRPLGGLTALKDIHGARDGRLLAIDGSDRLIEIFADGATRALFEGVTGAPFQWAELGYALFVQSPLAQWAIYPHRVIPWGSLVGAPAQDPATVPDDPNDGGLLALVSPVATAPDEPPPPGDLIGVRRNQMVVSVWETERDRSVLYFSRPDYPHHFSMDNMQIVPGRTAVMATVGSIFIIGTDRAIYLDAPDAPAQQVAHYGALRGGLVADDRGMTYLWTHRGLCRVAPFENMTDAALVPTLRARASGAMLAYKGSAYCAIHQSGAEMLRSSQRRYVPLAIANTHDHGIFI